jgi:hypothetical protein
MLERLVNFIAKCKLSEFAIGFCHSKKMYNAGLEITADQRSMIGRKLFLIGEEARLPFILIGEKYI